MDDKEIVTAGLMVMLLLQRQHIKLNRDVIFIAEAGEEGTPGVGIDFLVSRHWDEIAAEYALAEGGSAVAQRRQGALCGHHHRGEGAARSPFDRPRTVGACLAALADNAVLRLAAAVAKLGEWRTPMRLNETTRAYFERLASISPPADADRYRHVGDRRARPPRSTATSNATNRRTTPWCAPRSRPPCSRPASPSM